MSKPAEPTQTKAAATLWPTDFAGEAWSYGLDAFQRGILFLDVMRQRSERWEEHADKRAPHVLKFGTELIMDGREFLGLITRVDLINHLRLSIPWENVEPGPVGEYLGELPWVSTFHVPVSSTIGSS